MCINKKLKITLFYLKNVIFRNYAIKAYYKSIGYETLSLVSRHELRLHKLQKLVKQAYYNTNFYKEYYDQNGFHPDMFISLKDWEKVPILEKDVIRPNVNSLISVVANPKSLKKAKTGGSTGKPLMVYKDQSIPFEILSWRSLKWYGLHPSDNHGVVNRSVITKKWQKFLNMLIWWPTKRIFLDASSVTEENLANFVSLIEKKKIKFLVGYCGSLEKIADFILKENINIKSVSLIWSTTSPLTFAVRSKLEKAFQCKVMDQYGAIEVFHIAVQKPNENFLTVNDDYVHVDIVNSKNELLNHSGEMGDILVTDLHSHSFPIIKYRLGDRSRIIHEMDQSSDGFTKMDFVKGRISDRISFSDGSYLDGAFLTTICDGYEDVVDAYQIFQDSTYKIIFRIVLVSGTPKDHKRVVEVTDAFLKLVNQRTIVEVVFVAHIPDDRGKRRFIISDLERQVENNL